MLSANTRLERYIFVEHVAVANTVINGSARPAAFGRPDARRCGAPLGRLRDRWRHESRYVPATHRSPRPPRPARRHPAEPPPEPLKTDITAQFRHPKRLHVGAATRGFVLAVHVSWESGAPTDGQGHDLPSPALTPRRRLVSRHPDMPYQALCPSRLRAGGSKLTSIKLS
jgi:hypothetical protein